MVVHTLFTPDMDFFDSQPQYHPFLDSLDSLARLTWICGFSARDFPR